MEAGGGGEGAGGLGLLEGEEPKEIRAGPPAPEHGPAGAGTVATCLS